MLIRLLRILALFPGWIPEVDIAFVGDHAGNSADRSAEQGPIIGAKPGDRPHDRASPSANSRPGHRSLAARIAAADEQGHDHRQKIEITTHAVLHSLPDL